MELRVTGRCCVINFSLTRFLGRWLKELVVILLITACSTVPSPSTTLRRAEDLVPTLLFDPTTPWQVVSRADHPAGYSLIYRFGTPETDRRAMLTVTPQGSNHIVFPKPRDSEPEVTVQAGPPDTFLAIGVVTSELRAEVAEFSVGAHTVRVPVLDRSALALLEAEIITGAIPFRLLSADGVEVGTGEVPIVAGKTIRIDSAFETYPSKPPWWPFGGAP